MITKLAATAVVALACICGLVRAQEQFPTRGVTIITPIAAGAALDIMARLYADKLSRRLGQQVVVINRAGAGGMIGAQAAATAPADGYTMLFANSGHAILGALNKNLSFDPVADFSGVMLAGEAPAIVAVPASLGVSTLKEFVDLAKAKPGTINYGSAGIGTSTHLAGAYFALKTGIDIAHIPYTNNQLIVTDLVSGRIQAFFVPMGNLVPFLLDGRLRALAVGAREPATYPIPVRTAISQGYDYEYSTWYGMLARSSTPAPILTIFNQAMTADSRDPELVEKMRVQGIVPRDIGLERFDAHIRAEMQRLDPVLKAISSRN